MRRWMLTAVVVVTWGLAAPALASAQQTFAIGDGSGGNSFPANGNVPYTTTMHFDSGKTPQRALITTSPGVLAALSANPSCVQKRQIVEACHIGDGQAFLGGLAPAALAAYLVPPNDPAHDVAGVDLVASVGNPTHAEIQLAQNSAGNVSAVLNVDFSGAPPGITGSTLTVKAMLNGKPFTRMPSNCNPGPSSLTVQYTDGTSETTNASPDFSVTGCSALPYAPHLTGMAIKDTHDSGVKLTSIVTQTPGEAATAVNALKTPPALAPNVAGVSLQNTTTAVGIVTAVSPLLPTPLTGRAFLTGTPLQPTLKLIFPPPNALTLVGTVDLQTSTVTFTGVPDVPQTQLTVTLFGGPKALESAPCIPSSGPLVGTFTGQNGRTASATQNLVVSGCPRPRATLSAVSFSGRATRKPVLRFSLSKSFTGPKLRSFIVKLPTGLRFAAGKHARGISIPGGKVIALHGGRLTVRLTRPANQVHVRLAAPSLIANKHLARHLKLHIVVTDAAGNTTRLAQTF